MQSEIKLGLLALVFAMHSAIFAQFYWSYLLYLDSSLLLKHIKYFSGKSS